MRTRLLLAASAAMMLLILVGCAGPAPAPTATTAPLKPTVDLLSNAVYQSDMTASKTAKLAGGKYEEAAAPGSASKITVMLVPASLGLGDLNADAADDAAVILASSGGGSGTFISLHAVVSEKGALKDAAWVTLGDRVQVKSVAVSGGIITINMVRHGPNEPLCCPTQEATVKYKLQDGKLVTAP